MTKLWQGFCEPRFCATNSGVRRALLVVVAVLLLLAPAGPGGPDPLRGEQWNLDLIGVPGAHTVTRGDGAVVAVIDTGVDSAHEDLQGRLLPPANFVTGKTNANDEDGHGTHVTGIVAASTDNGLGVASVAPGRARAADPRARRGRRRAATPTSPAASTTRSPQQVDVINLSLGGTALSSFLPGGEFGDAVQRAVDAGIVVVAAAGNDTVPICEQPEVRGKILCVGAVDRSGMRSFYSSGDDRVDHGAGRQRHGRRHPLDGSGVEVRPDRRHVAGRAARRRRGGAAGRRAACADRRRSTGSWRPRATPACRARPGVRRRDPRRECGSGGPRRRLGRRRWPSRRRWLVGRWRRDRAEQAGAGERPPASRTVRSRGLRARCRAATTGNCAVTIRRGRTVLAQGQRAASAAGRTVKFSRPLHARGQAAAAPRPHLPRDRGAGGAGRRHAGQEDHLPPRRAGAPYDRSR